jgi:predicted  nucleic acid-binding Zn-ribbon protein
MNAQLRALVRLQELELRAAALRRELQSFPARRAAVERTTEQARSGLEQAQAAIVESHKKRRLLELDIEELREKIRRHRSQLYEVKTNEAYRALLQEIETAEQEVSRREDRLLEQMVAAEELDQKVAEARQKLAAAEKEAAEQRAQLDQQQAALERELAEVEAEAARVRSGLPEDLLDHYRRIASRHGGMAVAAVVDEACGLCRVRVRPHVMQLLRQPDQAELFHCESCTRILYLPEPEPASAATPAERESG